MIALAWSFFVVLSMLIASTQSFLTAPVSGYGLTTTTTTSDPGVEKRPLQRTVPLLDDDDDDDDSAEDEDYPMVPPSVPPTRRRKEEQTVYVIEFETEADAGKGDGHQNRAGKDMSDDGSDGQSPLDPWSIVWYIGSFGGLVAFFLIVSCSEWCCRRGARPLSVPYTQRGEVINAQPATESPPPPYHLFAPPPYDSVNYADLGADKSAHQAEKLDIYVITVPVHPQQQVQRQQQQHPPA